MSFLFLLSKFNCDSTNTLSLNKQLARTSTHLLNYRIEKAKCFLD